MRLLALAGKIDEHALGNALNQHISSLTLGNAGRFIRIHAVLRKMDSLKKSV
jgi:hypothetical protein